MKAKRNEVMQSLKRKSETQRKNAIALNGVCRKIQVASRPNANRFCSSLGNNDIVNTAGFAAHSSENYESTLRHSPEFSLKIFSLEIEAGDKYIVAAGRDNALLGQLLLLPSHETRRVVIPPGRKTVPTL